MFAIQNQKKVDSCDAVNMSRKSKDYTQTTQFKKSTHECTVQNDNNADFCESSAGVADAHAVVVQKRYYSPKKSRNFFFHNFF